MEERPYKGTELFTVRVWVENVGEPSQRQMEWRGKLCHVAHGTMWHFRGWPQMVDLMQTLSADLAQGSERSQGSQRSETFERLEESGGTGGSVEEDHKHKEDQVQE